MGIVTWYGWRGYGTISMSSTEDSIGPLTFGVAVERYLYDVASVWYIKPHMYVVQEPSLSSPSYC